MTETLAPAGGVSYTPGPSTFRGKRAAFQARPGGVKRVLRVAREAGLGTAIRAGFSLLYAKLRADSRVSDMRNWSDTAVDAWARRVGDGAVDVQSAVPGSGSGTSVSRQDMQQLLGRVTHGCSKTVHSDVFHMIVKRYCRRADNAQLASLRGALGTAPWKDQAPADDPTRMAWEALSATVDGELARRALVAPLKQMADALMVQAVPDVLDGACVRLAVALGRIAGDKSGHDVLVAALGHLTHAELRTLTARLSPRNTGGAAASIADNGPASCEMAQALRGVHRSPDLWQRRLGLIGDLQSAVGEALGEQLRYFVGTTSELIDFQRGRGKSGQAIHDMAAASLKKSLDTLRYPAFPGTPAGDKLVTRIILCALAEKKAGDLSNFLGELKPETLVDLLRAAEGPAEFEHLAQAMQRAREDRLSPHRGMVANYLRILDGCVTRGDRWSATRALNDLALSLTVWDRKCEQYGVSIPEDIERELHAAVKRTLSPMFRAPDNPVGPLNYGSLSILCDREIELLRESETRLEQYGLSLHSRALDKVARVRSAPHVAKGVEHAVAMIEMLAETPPAADRLVTSLYDCVDVLNSACTKQASFMVMGADDTARLSLEIMQQAWDAFAQRRPGQVVAARAGIAQFGRPLANGLLDAAICLVDDLDETSLNDDDRRVHPTAQASRLMRLASQLMEAVGSVSVPEGEEAPRDAPRNYLTSDWTPALRKGVAEQFGVHYDAAAGSASMVMTLAQHQEFARQLLMEDMTVKASSRREISSPGGTTVVEMDHQLIRDGIDRPSAQFSVSGIGRDGIYMPYTSSAPVPSEQSHVPGVERALLALQQVAGPDTVALTAYMTQSIAADFLRGLMALGTESPVRMEDGRAVLLGGGGMMRTDLTREADGSYTLRLGLQWDRLSTVAGYDGSGMQGIKLDAEKSFASMSCDVRLEPNPDGGWHREVTSPLVVRYHLVPITQQQEVD